MANIGSRVFEKSPSETVWKIGTAPSLWFHGCPKGRKKPHFADSSYLMYSTEKPFSYVPNSFSRILGE